MARTTHTLIGALLMCSALFAGCDGTVIPGPATTTTAGQTPSLAPAEEAQQIIDYFKDYATIRLPDDSRQLRVVKPSLQDSRAAAVISFIAPREQVINQTCHTLGADFRDRPPLIDVYPERNMLKDAGATIDNKDYGSCAWYESARKAFALIPNAEGGTTYVILYHMPYR